MLSPARSRLSHCLREMANAVDTSRDLCICCRFSESLFICVHFDCERKKKKFLQSAGHCRRNGTLSD